MRERAFWSLGKYIIRIFLRDIYEKLVRRKKERKTKRKEIEGKEKRRQRGKREKS